MEEKIYYVVRILNYMVQVGVAIYFFETTIRDDRKNNSKYKILIFLLLFISLAIFAYNNFSVVIIWYIIHYLYILIYKYNNKVTGMFWVIYYTVQGFVVNATILIISVSLFYDNWESFIYDKSYYKASIFVFANIVRIITLGVNFNKEKRNLILEYLDNKLMMIFSLILISIQVAYFFLIKSAIVGMYKVSIYECALAILLFTYNILFFKLFYFIIKGAEEKYELKKCIEQINYGEFYRKDVDRKYNEIKLWKHDYRNNMNVIANLANSNNKEKLHKYIEDFCEEIEKIESIVFTNSYIIDYVVSAKYNIAHKKGIEVKIEYKKVNQGIISDFDLNTILSNLLDNAIEGTKTARHKYINIIIYEKKNNIIIIIKNTYDGVMIYRNGIYLSTKTGNNRGLGLIRVNNCVEKYNGFMIITNDENMFENKVIIPNEKLNSS